MIALDSEMGLASPPNTISQNSVEGDKSAALECFKIFH